MNKLSLIVCYDKNSHGIGLNGDIPWSSNEDMIFFRTKTINTTNPDKINAVIMGRNTFLSLPRGILSSRINIVVSTTLTHDHVDERVIIVKSFDEAISLVNNDDNVEKAYIIGGKRLYVIGIERGIPEMYVNEIDFPHEYDVYFPDIPNTYHIVESYKANEDSRLQFTKYNL